MDNNNTPSSTPPLTGMNYAHGVNKGTYFSAGNASSTARNKRTLHESWENIGLSDCTPSSSPSLQGKDNAHAVPMQGLRTSFGCSRSDVRDNSCQRTKRTGPSGSYDSPSRHLRHKRSATMKQQVDSSVLERQKAPPPPPIQPSDIGRMVWVTGRERSKVVRHYGKIEALKEELDDDTGEIVGSTGKPAIRWMVLIRFHASATASEEWISADRIQFESPKNTRSTEKVVFTPITPPAKSPPKKRTKARSAQGAMMVTPLYQETWKATNRKNRSKSKTTNAVIVEQGKRPGDEYYKVEEITGFRLVDKRILFEIQWVGGEVTWEPLSCLSEEAFEAAKVLVAEALESKRGNKEKISPALIRIAKKEFDIDVK